MLHRRHTIVGLIFYFACIGLNSAPPRASINTCKSGQQTFLTVSRRKREMEDKMEKGRRVSAGAPMELRCGDGDESGNKSSMRSAETLLRLLPVALCTVSLVVMLKNSQTSDIGTLSYSDLGAFRYLVHANGICAGYSLLSAIFTAVPRPSTMCRAWTFFLLDQVLTYIILAAGSVSAEVQYLAYNGDEAVAWSDACSSFGVFCKKTTTSITITFVAVVCYAVLSLVSSYKLFTKYDAPISYNAKGIDLAGFHT